MKCLVFQYWRQGFESEFGRDKVSSLWLGIVTLVIILYSQNNKASFYYILLLLESHTISGSLVCAHLSRFPLGNLFVQNPDGLTHWARTLWHCFKFLLTISFLLLPFGQFILVSHNLMFSRCTTWRKCYWKLKTNHNRSFSVLQVNLVPSFTDNWNTLPELDYIFVTTRVCVDLPL